MKFIQLPKKYLKMQKSEVVCCCNLQFNKNLTSRILSD